MKTQVEPTNYQDASCRSDTLLFTTRLLSCAEKNMLGTSFTSQTFAQDRLNTLPILGNLRPAWCIQSLCSISREHREKNRY